MSAPKPTAERWNPRRESYDAFCNRKLRELARPIIERLLDERGMPRPTA